MTRVGVLLLSLTLCGLSALRPAASQEGQPGGEIAKLVGDWSGESLCADKKRFPACNDEQVVYHIVLAAGKSDTVTVTMDKIVDGKTETMGVSDFTYDAQRQALTSEYKNSRVHLVLELVVKGNLIEGTFSTLPDRAVARRVRVKKNE
jgi:hypothetical protein